MKTIVFDFDDTLTTYDTIFPFLFFANRDRRVSKSLKKSICLLLRLFYRLRWISNFGLKDWSIKLLIGGVPEEVIQKRSREYFGKITFHQNVYQQMEFYVASDSDTVIVSTASFADYVLYLKERFPRLIIQASLLDYEDGKVRGLKYNNYGADKVSVLKEKKIDLLYTDSLSDLPLAEKSTEIMKISKDGDIEKCEDLETFIQRCKAD